MEYRAILVLVTLENSLNLTYHIRTAPKYMVGTTSLSLSLIHISNYCQIPANSASAMYFYKYVARTP